MRLAQHGLEVADSSCVLCGHAEESTDHLFAQCPFTMECWRVLNVQAATDHAPGMHNWLFAHMKALSGKRMKYIYIIKMVKERVIIQNT
jgi:hypothetical protein